jgi:predicted nucleic acid-binding protein
VKVVSDASPLIAPARIGCLELLPALYGRVLIPNEVHSEVVVAGVGLPGSALIADASWIEVCSVNGAVTDAVLRTGLGFGEVSAVMLAKEVAAGLTLIDERRGRRYAKDEGLEVIGCVCILETLHRRGRLAELRDAYLRLLKQEFRIDRRTLKESLARLKLAP